MHAHSEFGFPVAREILAQRPTILWLRGVGFEALFILPSPCALMSPILFDCACANNAGPDSCRRVGAPLAAAHGGQSASVVRTLCLNAFKVKGQEAKKRADLNCSELEWSWLDVDFCTT